PDTQIGRCGKTGNWPWCHTHFEILRHAPATVDFWPAGWTAGSVKRHYHDPLAYLAVYQATRARGAAPHRGRPAGRRAGRGAPGPARSAAPVLTVAVVLDALRLANWEKHEMEAYIRDDAHRMSVDAAAQAEGNPPIVLLLRWARDHYNAGETAP